MARKPAAEVVAAAVAGTTLQAAGDKLGLTKERIRQLCNEYGIKRRLKRRGVPALMPDEPWLFDVLSSGDLAKLFGQATATWSTKVARQGTRRGKSLPPIANRARRHAAAKLRAGGMTWREIASAVGYSSPEVALTAVKLFKRSKFSRRRV